MGKNEGPGPWVPATKEEMKELSKEDIWDRIENAGEVGVIVESVEKGKGGWEC